MSTQADGEMLPVSEIIKLNEANQKWIHSFNWWFHNAKRDRIIENLREGVPLSLKNSKFLAAILEGNAKPLPTSQRGLRRFKSSIVDNKIKDLHTRGYTREEIRTELNRTGLAVINLGGLDKRLYRAKLDPVALQKKLDKRFDELYEKHSSI